MAAGRNDERKDAWLERKEGCQWRELLSTKDESYGSREWKEVERSNRNEELKEV